MVVGKKRQQAQHRHDFELQLFRLVRHSFRQAVQVQIQIADPHNGKDQEDTDADHQIVGITGSDHESWQMMGCGGMKRLAQENSPRRNVSVDSADRSTDYTDVIPPLTSETLI